MNTVTNVTPYAGNEWLNKFTKFTLFLTSNNSDL